MRSDARGARRSATRGWVATGRQRLARMRRRARQMGAGRGDGGIDQPPQPPDCPPGWRTGPPDFVGVGVQRCGTTRWFDLITSHPEVTRSVAAKELHYFDRFHSTAPGPEVISGYGDYFPRADGLTVGEWTPLYLSAPWIPPLLASAAPQARLLVLLRDPLDRYLSGLALDARVAARRGAPLSRYAPLEAFVRGLYHSQLISLLRHFERSRILVLQYERCTSEPATQLRRTFEFLNLRDVDFLPDLTAHPRRQLDKPALDTDTRSAYVHAYRDDVRGLIADFPEIDVRLWPNFADLSDTTSETPDGARRA